MLVNKSTDRLWKITETSGVERSLFRNNDAGGRSSFVRLKQQAQVPRHTHHGQEEVVVLSGTVLIGGVELVEGDYLFTQPGEEPDALLPLPMQSSSSLRRRVRRWLNNSLRRARRIVLTDDDNGFSDVVDAEQWLLNQGRVGKKATTD